MSVTLHFNNQQSGVRVGATLFECAESLGIRVPTSCIKQGKCKECMVEVVEGMEFLSERSPKENHLRDNFRLSCQTKIVSEKGNIRCHTMRRGAMKVERQAMHLPANHLTMKIDPCVTRDGERILIDGTEISRSSGPIYGLALDLGTTTIVLRLLNLETGEIVADSSFENPQRFGGSDVMSRIHYDTHHRGKLLQRTLAGYLTHAIEEFPVDPKSIYEMVVAGNSTMRDLFFGLNVYSIGQNPYQSLTEIEVKEGTRITTSLTATPRRLLLPMHPKGRVYGLPVISGHVGADAAACMLAVDILNEERLIAVMDIGTNTEIIVGNKHKIVAASCPAGPAFEGGKISCGMPGLPGAIEKAAIREDGSVQCSVIDNVAAEGICGSGLVDIISELLRTGKMNSLGRFEEGNNEIILDSNAEQKIFLSESDVNELAQAKGANVAGLHIVFHHYGIRFDDVDLFYLAGGFGRHLDVASAKRIGLIPNIGDSKIVQVGNASIEGASIALLSRMKRAELEEAVKRTTHCRLESDPNFFNYFVDGCQFTPVESASEYHSGDITRHA
ncbi:MAG: ASKHA domain-containing protein [Bacteroidota bacterium]